MKKLAILLLSLFFSACVNKHGISLKYYSDCNEYYDMQGYYHKECGKDDLFTYKGVADGTKSAYNSTINFVTGKKQTQGNVW